MEHALINELIIPEIWIFFLFQARDVATQQWILFQRTGTHRTQQTVDN